MPYYERAAKNGLPDAQYAMSQILANGLGGKKPDNAEARKWLVRAARQNFDTAQLDLGTWLISGRGGERDEKSGFFRGRARRNPPDCDLLPQLIF